MAAYESEEAERRLKIALGTSTIRPEISREGDQPRLIFGNEIEAYKARAQETLMKTWDVTIQAVKQELDDGSCRLKFHGKTILARFYQEHVQRVIPKYQNFVFQLAREVGVSEIAKNQVGRTIEKINRYFPRGLLTLLSEQEVREFAAQIGIDHFRILEWARERVEYFEGARDAISSTGLEQEKLLLSLMNHSKLNGRPDLYSRLRPFVVDVISR
jgi:hypothetical protein